MLNSKPPFDSAQQRWGKHPQPRSLDGAQRNPGEYRQEDIPDSTSLHPGYKLDEAKRRYLAYQAGKVPSRPAEEVLRDARNRIKSL